MAEALLKEIIAEEPDFSRIVTEVEKLREAMQTDSS